MLFMFITPALKEQVEGVVGGLRVVGVGTMENAIEVAKKAAADGVKIIELCGGFGNIGTGKIQEAAGPDVCVGSVKFDRHPAMKFRSGDTLFL